MPFGLKEHRTGDYPLADWQEIWKPTPRRYVRFRDWRRTPLGWVLPIDVGQMSATSGHLLIGDPAVRAAAKHPKLTDSCLSGSKLEPRRPTDFSHSWTRRNVFPSQIHGTRQARAVSVFRRRGSIAATTPSRKWARSRIGNWAASMICRHFWMITRSFTRDFRRQKVRCWVPGCEGHSAR